MRSVSTINKQGFLLTIFLAVFNTITAQENSPFSRYGLGDIYPSKNIINRSMGGVHTVDSNATSVNFNNPATYSDFYLVTYDIGITVDSRTLKSANPAAKYNSVNFSPSYLSLGFPLSTKKNIGMAVGIRPITRVSYSIEENKRLPADSMAYIYQGDGGLYQGFIGIGKRWGNLNIGFNTGFQFGRKESKTTAIPVDSVQTYKSNSTTTASFGSSFLSGGIQYTARINKLTTVRFGLTGTMKQQLSATQQIQRETFAYDFNGNPITIDSVYKSPEVNGTIQLPSSYAAGIAITKSAVTKNIRYEKLFLGIEYESSQWSQFRYFGELDKLQNNWQVKIGGKFLPNAVSTNYWNRVTYRAGFYFGKDAINADGNGLSVYAFSIGTGFLVGKHRSYDNQWTNINTTFEFGKRGNNNNNITENFFRFSVGLNLSDKWFGKRKYD